MFYPESTYSLQIYSVVDIEPFCDGQSVSFSISASLPNGLSFNTNNGHITGTPTESNSLTTYTITATNSQSTTSTTLVMEITTLYCEVDDGWPRTEVSHNTTKTCDSEELVGHE